MDVLAGFHAGGRASLDHMATLLGFPGKLAMSGDQVWTQYLAGELAAIRHYCETDALNTYLVYLRFQLMRRVLDETRYQDELTRLEEKLERSAKPHLTPVPRRLASGRSCRTKRPLRQRRSMNRRTRRPAMISGRRQRARE